MLEHKAILLPHSSATTNPRWSQIEELLFVPSSEWSPREVSLIANCTAYGELYPGRITEMDMVFQIEVDLGNPEDILKVEFPRWVNKKLAAMIVAEAAEKLE